MGSTTKDSELGQAIVCEVSTGLQKRVRLVEDVTQEVMGGRVRTSLVGA